MNWILAVGVSVCMWLVPPTSSAAEVADWAQAMEIGDCDAYERFLEQHPTGSLSVLAAARRDAACASIPTDVPVPVREGAAGKETLGSSNGLGARVAPRSQQDRLVTNRPECAELLAFAPGGAWGRIANSSGEPCRLVEWSGPALGELTPRQELAVYEFLTAFLRAANGGDLDEMIALYGEEIDYFALGRVGRSTVRKDKKYVIDRWPISRYLLASSVKGQVLAGNAVAIELDVEFDVYSPARGKGVRGRTTNALTINWERGAFRVVRIRENVRSREEYP